MQQSSDDKNKDEVWAGLAHFFDIPEIPEMSKTRICPTPKTVETSEISKNENNNTQNQSPRNNNILSNQHGETIVSGNSKKTVCRRFGMRVKINGRQGYAPHLSVSMRFLVQKTKSMQE